MCRVYSAVIYLFILKNPKLNLKKIFRKEMENDESKKNIWIRESKTLTLYLDYFLHEHHVQIVLLFILCILIYRLIKIQIRNRF